MDPILLFLLKKNAHRQPVRLSTAGLGTELGMSQQNASRRLAILENEGHIERKDMGIVITKKAFEELAKEYSELKSVFEGPRMQISGILTSGIGEGRYYMSLDGYRKEIRERLGFEPFPGTFNIELPEKEMWKRARVLALDPITIPGFRAGGRTFGDIFAYRCTVAGRDCAIVVPLRTHHKENVLEIISDFNMRKELGKSDGEHIEVSF